MASIAIPLEPLPGVDEQDFSKSSEDELISACRNGNRVAFEEVVNRHGAAILRLALRMTGSEDDAREVFQNTFLKTLTAIKHFECRCQLKSWLYRIAANFCIALLRERTASKQRNAFEEGEDQNAIELPVDTLLNFRPQWNPECHLISNDIACRINQALGRLTPRERTVFELKHCEGLRLREIGIILGTTEETAKNTLFRATKKLRMQLAPLL